jgi:membrane-associated protease RseP (regulator of RpoE activity)
MGVTAAILGLALLVMIHEAGHFFAARAVGMTPRKFYLGFGPPIFKRTRGGVEYGIGSIPLGGYVKIPGMNRPSPGDLTATLPSDVREENRAELARFDVAIERGDDAAALTALAELPPAVRASRIAQELEWSLAPDAYWRQATWRRLVAIAAGPAVIQLMDAIAKQ